MKYEKIIYDMQFQSTPSVGRATLTSSPKASKTSISIHALRGEGDGRGFANDWHFKKFQSTPSVGRATKRKIKVMFCIGISIHALRGEGDAPSLVNNVIIVLFQSTPSVGRATATVCRKLQSVLFQSTPSVGRATIINGYVKLSKTIISIHALRGEGDDTVPFEVYIKTDFNPRPPWGGRRHRTVRGLYQD